MRALILILLLGIPGWAQNVSPAPNSSVSTGQPSISATFLTPIRSAKVLIDGRDVSAQARLVVNQVVLTPNPPLDPGLHQVGIEATNLLGLKERANWVFSVTGAAAGGKAPSAYTPAGGTTVDGARPTVSASFPETIVSARLSIDRTDVSSQVQVAGDRASWLPQADLPAGSHIAQIDARGTSGQTYSGSWLFTTRAAAATPSPSPSPGTTTGSGLSNFNPPPGAQLPVARPWVSADFPQPVNNPRMIVDGVDVSAQATKSSTRISWTPAYDLQVGQHTVVVDGVGQNGQVVAGSWSFVVSPPPPPPPPPPR